MVAGLVKHRTERRRVHLGDVIRVTEAYFRGRSAHHNLRWNPVFNAAIDNQSEPHGQLVILWSKNTTVEITLPTRSVDAVASGRWEPVHILKSERPEQ
jgi:hypothetical protein